MSGAKLWRLPAVACGLVVLLAGHLAGARSVDSAAYQAALDKYCASGAAATKAALSEWRASQIDEALRIAKTFNPRRRMAAAALHAEVYAGLWVSERGRVSSAHGDASRSLALSTHLSSPRDPLVRQWTLAWGYFLLGHLFLSDAERHFAQSRSWFPDDGDLIVAAGVVHELMAHPLGQQTVRATLNGASIRRQRAMAASFYELATKKAPLHAEALLRLGRLQFLDGDSERSMNTLSRVAGLSIQPRERFLVHLFLGQLRETNGEIALAAKDYETALSYAPAPTALVALSASRALLGGRLTDEETKSLLRDVNIDVEDPWSEYLFTRPYRFARTIEALRIGACGP